VIRDVAITVMLAACAFTIACASTSRCKEVAALCSSKLVICADSGECACLGAPEDDDASEEPRP
jgi:hypothetical protein